MKTEQTTLMQVFWAWRRGEDVALLPAVLEYMHDKWRNRAGLMCDDRYLRGLEQCISAYSLAGFVWGKTQRLVFPIAIPDTGSVLVVYISEADDLDETGQVGVEVRVYLEENRVESDLCLGGVDMSRVEWETLMDVLGDYHTLGGVKDEETQARVEECFLD